MNGGALGGGCAGGSWLRFRPSADLGTCSLPPAATQLIRGSAGASLASGPLGLLCRCAFLPSLHSLTCLANISKHLRCAQWRQAAVQEMADAKAFLHWHEEQMVSPSASWPPPPGRPPGQPHPLCSPQETQMTTLLVHLPNVLCPPRWLELPGITPAHPLLACLLQHWPPQPLPMETLSRISPG